ncbi:MAG: four helix bundle protein [candidate division WOR-3 bacterium]|nr:four helix bundle protein [candidate division WOR-3 bacterium]
MKKPKIKNVWDMDVFKLAHVLTLQVYEKTRTFPRFELYSLISQMRRAASSVPMNIAEGAARNTRLEYRRFVSIAKGSVGEISYQIILSRDLGYLTNNDSDDLLKAYDRVGMMLTRLAHSLAQKARTSL